MIAANAPNCAEVLPELGHGVGRDRRGQSGIAELVAARRLEDLRQELREQRRSQSHEQEQPGDDRQAVRPPRFEQLLAATGARAGSRAALRSSRVATADEPQEHVLERRADPFEDRPGGLPRRRPAGSRPAAAAASSATDTTIRSSPSPPTSSTRSTQRRRPKGRDEPGDRLSLSRVGFDPIERQGVAGQQVVERPLGHQAPVVEDPDPVADPFDVGKDVGREDDGRARRGARR